MNVFIIDDSRKPKDFNDRTFSGYCKKQVFAEFKKALMGSMIESSCYWAVELLCSGEVDKIYELFIHIICKIINVNNPRLPYKIYMRYNFFIRIKTYLMGNISKKEKDREKTALLRMRNSQQIRNHICELCVIICLSTKTKGANLVSIKNSDFSIDNMKAKFGARDDSLIKSVIRYGDPDEAQVVLNEFYYGLKTHKWKIVVYWLSWILTWEKINIKKDKLYSCGYREINNIDKKYYYDIIWFIWEIILKESENMENLVNIQIHALYKMYKYEYTPNKKSKKMVLLLCAIKYFTEFYSIHSNSINDYSLLVRACGRINQLFTNIKEHQVNNIGDDQYKIHKTNYILNNNDPRKRSKKITVRKIIKEDKDRHQQISESKIITLDKLDAAFLNRKSNPKEDRIYSVKEYSNSIKRINNQENGRKIIYDIENIIKSNIN